MLNVSCFLSYFMSKGEVGQNANKPRVSITSPFLLMMLMVRIYFRIYKITPYPSWTLLKSFLIHFTLFKCGSIVWDLCQILIFSHFYWTNILPSQKMMMVFIKIRFYSIEANKLNQFKARSIQRAFIFMYQNR